ncbi:hypothetical protein T484DRAFT_1898220 [Baffinella frigidus]|nr:hypothetical protein T484DRAFT_1898220 [Cryptophyta sp. CCMP2293]
MCDAGFYCEPFGGQMPCPAFSWSGFTGPDGGPCVPCPAGSYKPTNGSGGCTGCPALPNATSLPGSGNVSECTCKAGWVGGDGGAECAVCPAGTYKMGNGTGVCTACPAGTSSPSPGSASNASCLPCLPGEYASTAGRGACKVCPGMSVSGAGASACSNDVAAVQASAIIAGNLSAFLLLEETYLQSYAQAAGLGRHLVSTLSMVESTSARRELGIITTVEHTFFIRSSAADFESIMLAFTSGGFSSLLAAVLLAKGYPAPTVTNPQRLRP